MEHDMTDYKDPGLNQVAEFHRAFGAHINLYAEVPRPEDEAQTIIEDYAVAAGRLGKALRADAADAAGRGDAAGSLLLIRLQLIQEELAELAMAIADGDVVEALDALTDIDYVVNGTYLALGLAEYKVPARDEVHQSNMSKLGEDGKAIVEASGRVVKGPNYRRPNLRAVLGIAGRDRA